MTTTLRLDRGDFEPPSAQSPARCTITFTTATVTAGTVTEPNVSKQFGAVDIDVIEKNDARAASYHFTSTIRLDPLAVRNGGR